MNTDIRIKTSFLAHRKRRKLEKKLGKEAVVCLIDLWLNTAVNRPKGDLSGMDCDDIAIDADWNGDPKEFCDILVDLGFLDLADGVYSIHDWETHQGWAFHAEERSEKARRAAQARWEKKSGIVNSDATSNATSMQGAMLNDAKGNAPSPNPSPSPTPNPNPSLKNTLCDESHDKGEHGGNHTDRADNLDNMCGCVDTGGRRQDQRAGSPPQSPGKQITQPTTQGDQDESINTRELPTQVRGNNHHDPDSATAQETRSGHNPPDAGGGSADGQEASVSRPPRPGTNSNRIEKDGQGLRAGMGGAPGSEAGNRSPRIGEQGTPGTDNASRKGKSENSQLCLSNGGNDANSKKGSLRAGGEEISGTDGRRPEEPRYRTKPVAKPFTLSEVRQMRPSWWNQDEWEDLIDLRRKKRAAQTKRAYNQLINEFEKAKKKGYTADEILNAMNSGTGWSGFKLEWMKESPRIYRMKQEKPQHSLVECQFCQGFNDCTMKGQGKLSCPLYTPKLTIHQGIREAIG